MTLAECQAACELCNSCHAWDPLWPLLVVTCFVAGFSFATWIIKKEGFNE